MDEQHFADPVTALSELAAIAEQVAELSDQARSDLASWATVAAHLAQARDQATALARSLRHAAGTLDHNRRSA
ncbi:hypothetical protein ABT337_11650 [Saccharopolyspora hirsuta]|uniref:hypothetical protein n=1 Tax=Saccharopolyspora hirsuta TaxID=1837 RepID=UPI0033187EE7